MGSAVPYSECVFTSSMAKTIVAMCILEYVITYQKISEHITYRGSGNILIGTAAQVGCLRTQVFPCAPRTPGLQSPSRGSLL